MAQADRGSSQDHIHRNARLGPRRSLAMTLGISAVRYWTATEPQPCELGLNA
jgi:hypothetical protein